MAEYLERWARTARKWTGLAAIAAASLCAGLSGCGRESAAGISSSTDTNPQNKTEEKSKLKEDKEILNGIFSFYTNSIEYFNNQRQKNNQRPLNKNNSYESTFCFPCSSRNPLQIEDDSGQYFFVFRGEISLRKKGGQLYDWNYPEEGLELYVEISNTPFKDFADIERVYASLIGLTNSQPGPLKITCALEFCPEGTILSVNQIKDEEHIIKIRKKIEKIVEQITQQEYFTNCRPLISVIKKQYFKCN